MKLHTTIFSVLLLLCMSTVGCGILSPRSEVTPEQRAVAIKSLARTGTFIAITEIYESDEAKAAEKALEIKTVVEEQVLPLVRGESVVLDNIVTLLESSLDPRYLIYMQQAIDMLSLYYEAPNPGEMVDPDSRMMIEALLDGVIEGAQQAIVASEDQASVFIDPNWVRVSFKNSNSGQQAK